ncbi:choice-of-anchor D domain-containing protein [Thalassobellus citreus]|uniref:choice-of-anchor D domain-containing protein n=1 Tax=Thalassobellus citreus TaxID=3367752 RepID=UPI00379A8BD8
MKKLSFFLVFLLLFTCNKDDDVSTESVSESVSENIVLITDDNSELKSTEEQLDAGTYVIQFTGELPDVVKGDIIIGDEGEGFLRKVTTVLVEGDVVSYKTEQATMEDVFINADISFNTDISETSKSGNNKSSNNNLITVNYKAEGVTLLDDGLTFDFSNTPITDNLKISKGSVSFNPNFYFDWSYSLGSLESFNFKTENTDLTIDCDLLLSESGSVSGSHKKTLVDYNKYITVFVSAIPVIISINTKLIAKLNQDLDAEFHVTSGFTNTNTLTLGATYKDNAWNSIYNLNSEFQSKPVVFGGSANLTSKLTIVPEVSVKFYGVIGPYFTPEMYLETNHAIAVPSLDWYANLIAGTNIGVGAKATILGKTLANYNKTYSSSETIMEAPSKIEIISGNEQIGTQGANLKDPIKVKVIDKAGFKVSNVPVYFNVTTGGGSVSETSIITDDEGFAEVTWVLGKDSENQEVSVNIKKPDGTTLGAPIVFKASSNAVFIELSGDLDFGNVALNTTVEKTLTITNSFDAPIEVNSIELPEAFTVDWISGTVQANSTQNIVISFTPTKLEDYNGVVTINNDVDEINNTINVSGVGVNAYTLAGDLNFGDVAVNSGVTRTLSITNNLQRVLNISLIDLPTGFFASWTGGDIGVNSTQEVIITFIPTEVKAYSGNAIVNSDSNQEDNNIGVSGNGVEYSIIGTWKVIEERGKPIVYNSEKIIFREDCPELISSKEFVSKKNIVFSSSTITYSENASYTSYHYYLLLNDCSYESFNTNTSTSTDENDSINECAYAGNRIIVDINGDELIAEDEGYFFEFVNSNIVKLSVSSAGVYDTDYYVLERL